jgi:acetyl esterase/lipase
VLVAAALVLVVAVVAIVLAVSGDDDGPTTTGDVVCEPQGEPVATVLLFHPGGFVGGRAEDLRPECDAFAHDGYRAVSVEYSYEFGQALKDVAERARRYGKQDTPLFAYGLSSGGTYAAMLAERGDVDAAFSYGGVYDIAAWVGRGNQELLDEMGATTEELDRASPLNAPLKDPARLLIGHNPDDVIAPYAAATRMAGRSKQFRLRTFREPANGYAAHTIHPTAAALAYFRQKLEAPRR